MKFDAIVGNPPYQLENSGDGSGKDPIYHLFVDLSQKVGDLVTLIHPARFLFNAGKTPKEWTEKMLSDEHLLVVDYFENSVAVFPTVDIKGGVAITIWNKAANYGKIGLFMTHNELTSIIEKTRSDMPFSEIVYPMDLYRVTETLYVENQWADGRQSKGHRFAMGSNVFKIFPELFYERRPEKAAEYIQIYGLANAQRTIRWVKKSYVKLPDNFCSYRVLIAKVNGSGAFGETLTAPFIIEPNTGHTATFLSIGNFESHIEAEAALKYIKTKFTRALLGTLKVTHDNPKNTWKNVPIQDFSIHSDIDWSVSIPEIDKQLYAKYNLSPDEISFIETMIKPME